MNNINESGSVAEKDISVNYFYKKKVIALQGKKGYRFSVDAPILADFLPFNQDTNALEIGAGNGIVSLLAIFKNKYSSITAIEIQEKLCEIAGLNIVNNGFSGRLKIIHGNFNFIYNDFSGISEVYSNPPFYKTNQGRLSPNKELVIAKTESSLTLKELFKNTAKILANPGNLYLILPFSRYDEIKTSYSEIGYYSARERFVFSREAGKPERFLIQLTNYPVLTATKPPLILFKDKGIYSSEMENILSGN